MQFRVVKLLHFMLFTLLMYIIIEWQHEDNLYKNIGHMAVLKAGTTVDTAVVNTAMFSINQVMRSRHDLFQDHQELSWKQDVFHSADIDLMYGTGACGGFSNVLARTLQILGYDVRIGQLKTLSYGFGGHIVIEYYSNFLKKWVMIDPLFTYIPKNSKGEMASVREVQHHWTYFAKTMPTELSQRFRFNDVRYTNWTRMGGVPKIIYYTAKLFRGKPYADSICLRMYALSTFPMLFWGLVASYFLVLFIGYYGYKRKLKCIRETQLAN